ncbi:DUF2851 family protein [Deltaproteobacteria bacterium TL4]
MIFKESEKHETWVQALWASQPFSPKVLQTLEGESLSIDFQGWLNKDSGPDFSEARIQIGPNDYFGSVEIHLQSSSWYTHHHHLNPDYNNVILHVVLYKDNQQPILRENGTPVPEIEIAAFLNADRISNKEPPEYLLAQYEEFPGKCGVHVLQEGRASLRKLIAHAAEQRIQQKTQKILDRWEEQPPEELLFQMIFRSLGYSAYAHSFEELARLYPFDSLLNMLKQPQRYTRVSILSRWFGACGLLDNPPALIEEPTLRKEMHQWQAEWHQASSAPKVSAKLSQGYRPQNSPERRMIGLYHHLRLVAVEGLLKSWLKMLQQLDVYRDQEGLKKQVLKQTQLLFETPDWEIWQTHFSSSSSSQPRPIQLIGTDRQTILWANAILPFFLAFARQEKDRNLEKLLYQIFLVLPPESSNKHTRFMEKRLQLPKKGSNHYKTLGSQQGLIQISQDFCHNFYQGCKNCEFVELLKSESEAGVPEIDPEVKPELNTHKK